MHRSSLPEHGLRIAIAAVVSLVLAPAARAEDGSPAATDPAALAAELVDPAGAVEVAAAAVSVAMPVDPTAMAAEAVPAAAVEQMALEPQPTPELTPPPPPPAAVDPYVTPPEELAPPPPAPEPEPVPVEELQYQPEQPQYQQSQAAPAPEAPAAPPPAAPPAPEAEGSWDWTWSCGDATALAQPPAIRSDSAPRNWSWNWDWNCGPDSASKKNRVSEMGTQYQPVIARYHPVNVNVSIRIDSPGNDGPVLQTNVVVAVAAQPLVTAVQAPEPAPPEPAEAIPRSGSDPAADSPLGEAPEAPANTKLASSTAPDRAAVEAPSWNARPVPPKRLQPTQEAHRSRPQLRQPTRRPLPPMRVPSIPVSSAGAAPLGGADGGGFQLALLLVPFALALVDSARRLVRDTAPPVARERDKRRKRPG